MAIDTLERLVKLYPDQSAGYIGLANAYESGAGDIDKAIQFTESAVRIARTGTAVGNLASYYMIKGLYQKAEDVCRSFLQDVEYNLWVQFVLMSSYTCQRKFDLALAAG